MLAAHALFMTGVGLPPPTITNVSPTYIATGYWQTLTITGTNFVPGQTTVSVTASSTGTPTVSSDGTSLTVSNYIHSPGTLYVTVTTPFGSVTASQTILAVVPVTVTSVSRDTSVIYIYGSNLSGCQAYVVASGTSSGYKPTYDYGSYLMVYTGVSGPGQFFLSNPTTGGGTGWISYS